MVQLPFPATGLGRWSPDPAHTEIGSVARHVMVPRVRGRCTFTGTITSAADPRDPHADVSSITTGIRQRDSHLASTDFVDAAGSPRMTYRSTSIRSGGDYLAVGG